jgi:iron-sulfur cluster repair protein YtfE (RIC family)
MKSHSQVNNPLLVLSQEHQLVFDQLKTLDTLLASGDLPSLIGDLQARQQTFLGTVLQHFNLEETIFFPAVHEARAGAELATMVITLARDHGRLEAQLRQILAKLQPPYVSFQHLQAQLLEDLHVLSQAFKDHARREVEEFFPRLHQNPHCAQIISRALDR